MLTTLEYRDFDSGHGPHLLLPSSSVNNLVTVLEMKTHRVLLSMCATTTLGE